MPDSSAILRTPRLELRRWTAADIEPSVALWTDPEVTRHMGGPRDPDRVREALRESLETDETFDLWPLLEPESGRMVGNCGLLRKEIDGVDEVEVIYVIERASRGCGYAAEIAAALAGHALDMLGCPRVVALIDPENVPSERVALRAGMRLDRETVRSGGRVLRVYVSDARGAEGRSDNTYGADQ